MDVPRGILGDAQPTRIEPLPNSVRYQDRQGGRRQDMAGGPAEDHLAQPALRIGSLDQEVGAQCPGLLQDRLADTASLWRVAGLRGDPGALEITGEVVAGRPFDKAALDAQHD